MGWLEDIQTWLGLGKDVKSTIAKFDDFEKVMTGILKKQADFLENMQIDISKMQTDIKKHLPNLEEIEKYTKQTKTAINTVNTTIASMHSTLTTAKESLGDIKTYTGYLETIGTDIGAMKLTDIKAKNYLEDIKTKIADNLPKLGKLDQLTKLDELTKITSKINELKNTISSLDIKLPESLNVKLDPEAFKSLQNIDLKMESMDKKLSLLEDISNSLTTQNYTIEYGVNLLRQNLPLTASFFDMFDKLNKLNLLGLQAVKLNLTPMDYIDKIQQLLYTTESFKFDVPEFKPPSKEPEPQPYPYPYPFPDPFKNGKKIDTVPENIISMENGDLILNQDTEITQDSIDSEGIGAYLDDQGEVVIVGEGQGEITPETIKPAPISPPISSTQPLPITGKLDIIKL